MTAPLQTHTHKEIAAATSSALYIKTITVDEERESRAAC